MFDTNSYRKEYMSKKPKRTPAGRSLRRSARLRQLELLAALERAPTLSAAARETRLSQPAASKLLGTLSADLAIDLFEKSGRTLRPTAAGQALIRHAANLIGNLERAFRHMWQRFCAGQPPAGFDVDEGWPR